MENVEPPHVLSDSSSDFGVPLLTGAGEGKVGSPPPVKVVRKFSKAQPFIDIELTSMRRTIAKRLLQSKVST